MPRFASLPAEILLEIARYCSWAEALALALTSRALVQIGLEGVYHALNGEDGRGRYLSRRRTWSFLWTLLEYPRVAQFVRTAVRSLQLKLDGGWRVRYANDYDAHRCLGRALGHPCFDKVCVLELDCGGHDFPRAYDRGGYDRLGFPSLREFTVRAGVREGLMVFIMGHRKLETVRLLRGTCSPLCDRNAFRALREEFSWTVSMPALKVFECDHDCMALEEFLRGTPVRTLGLAFRSKTNSGDIGDVSKLRVVCQASQRPPEKMLLSWVGNRVGLKLLIDELAHAAPNVRELVLDWRKPTRNLGASEQYTAAFARDLQGLRVLTELRSFEMTFTGTNPAPLHPQGVISFAEASLPPSALGVTFRTSGACVTYERLDKAGKKAEGGAWSETSRSPVMDLFEF